ncbi:MAG: ABC transporter substrate-binding protein [Desulfobacteraceae bacterium]|jgi:branched-chain amino acid transport system substrate-binding protein
MRNIFSIPFMIGAMILTAFTGMAVAADNQDGPIVIGVLENATYAFAPMMKGSLNIAMEKINARGGINGRPIKLIFADDGGRKEMGTRAVKKLVKDEKVAMLVGGYSSSNTLFMAQAAHRLDVPFLVCTAADDRITQRKKNNIFRLNPPAAEYTKGLEELLLQKIKPASMAIIYENSPYGTGGGLRMMYFCRENDIEIVDIIPYHRERAGADYFDRLIKPLKNNPPDVIYMVSYTKDAVELVKRIRAAKIDSLFCGGAGGFTHPDFISKTGKASQHLLTATLWTADQEDALAKQYADLYRAKYKQTPDYHGAEAYSALMVAADALRRSKSLKANDIRDALANTDLSTPFGRVKFGSHGKYERQNIQVTLVLQVLGDQYRCVWPQAVSVAELVLPQK